jgi:hypothetical protein
MRIFKAFSHIKPMTGVNFNFSNSTNSKQPTIIINIIKPTKVNVNYTNESNTIRKKEKICFDDLSRNELQQLLDFVV